MEAQIIIIIVWIFVIAFLEALIILLETFGGPNTLVGNYWRHTSSFGNVGLRKGPGSVIHQGQVTRTPCFRERQRGYSAKRGRGEISSVSEHNIGGWNWVQIMIENSSCVQ